MFCSVFQALSRNICVTQFVLFVFQIVFIKRQKIVGKVMIYCICYHALISPNGRCLSENSYKEYLYLNLNSEQIFYRNSLLNALVHAFYQFARIRIVKIGASSKTLPAHTNGVFSCITNAVHTVSLHFHHTFVLG